MGRHKPQTGSVPKAQLRFEPKELPCDNQHTRHFLHVAKLILENNHSVSGVRTPAVNVQAREGPFGMICGKLKKPNPSLSLHLRADPSSWSRIFSPCPKPYPDMGTIPS